MDNDGEGQEQDEGGDVGPGGDEAPKDASAVGESGVSKPKPRWRQRIDDYKQQQKERWAARKEKKASGKKAKEQQKALKKGQKAAKGLSKDAQKRGQKFAQDAGKKAVKETGKKVAKEAGKQAVKQTGKAAVNATATATTGVGGVATEAAMDTAEVAGKFGWAAAKRIGKSLWDPSKAGQTLTDTQGLQKTVKRVMIALLVVVGGAFFFFVSLGSLDMLTGREAPAAANPGQDPQDAKLTITIVPSTYFAVAGDPITYTITATSTKPVSNIVIDVTVPEGTHLGLTAKDLTYKPRCPIVCDAKSERVSWNSQDTNPPPIVITEAIFEFTVIVDSNVENKFITLFPEGRLGLEPVSAITTAKGDCALTMVGTPEGDPPEGCSIPFIGNLQLPPNLKCLPVGPENSWGLPGFYCQLPPAVPPTTRDVFYSEPSFPNLYQKHEQSNKWQEWGSQEMIAVLYTVAKAWRMGAPATAHRPAIPPHPKGHLIVMDIASDYHSEHKWGVAVDVFATTDGTKCAASIKSWRCSYGPNDLAGTIHLGQLFIDTGYFNAVWYSDTNANGPLNAYARSVDPARYPAGHLGGFSGFRPVTEPHWDHFHLLIDRAQQKNPLYYVNFQKSKLKDCEFLSGALRDVCY